MSASERLVDAAASWSGDSTGRRREEWRADLAGAESLGIARGRVVLGALRAAVGIRGAEARRMPSAASGGRRLRWAATALTVAALLATGVFLTTGASSAAAEVMRAFLLIAAAALVGIGVVQSARGASAVAGRRAWVGVIAVIAVPLLVVVVLFAGVAALLVLGFLLGFIVLAVAMAAPVSSRPDARATWPGLPARMGSRITGLLGASAVLAATAAAVLHVLVWNPTAKVPGLELTEIYRTMAERGESPASAIGMVAFWASGWIALALVLLLAGPVGRRGILRRFDARRVARTALVAVGGIGLSAWLAGFSMGMSLADAFMTTGGDAAGTGIALSVIGMLAGVVAALRILPPPLRLAA